MSKINIVSNLWHSISQAQVQLMTLIMTYEFLEKLNEMGPLFASWVTPVCVVLRCVKMSAAIMTKHGARHLFLFSLMKICVRLRSCWTFRTKHRRASLMFGHLITTLRLKRLSLNSWAFFYITETEHVCRPETSACCRLHWLAPLANYFHAKPWTPVFMVVSHQATN